MSDSGERALPRTFVPLGLGDTRASFQHRYAAAGICAALGFCTAAALLFGLAPGPEIKLLVPISATVWSVADALTAALLIAQFFINGRLSFAILSSAFAFAALMTWPFLLTFPGVFATPGRASAHQDLFVYFWMSWHFCFPLLVLVATHESLAARILLRPRVVLVSIATLSIPPLLAAALVAGLYAVRDALPRLVVLGQLQPVDRIVFHPVIVALNAAACIVLLSRGKRTSTLQLWLCVAMFSTCLDSLLIDSGAATYSYAWDVGKLVAVSTACVVLIMILCELLMLYRRQARVSESLAHELVVSARSEAELTQDIRARRSALLESERQYRSLAEALPHIVWTAVPAGGLDHFNRRCYDYTGKTLEELAGAGWLSVLHPDDVEEATASWEQAIRSGTPYESEFRIRRASDGSYRRHLAKALPICDANGSVTRWFGTCTDIDDQRLSSEAAGRLTEQVRLNATLEQDLRARRRAEAALNARDELLRQVEAHSPVGLALVALNGQFLRVNPALCAITGLRESELFATTFAQLMNGDDLETDAANVARALAGGSASFEMEARYVLAGGRSAWVQSNCTLVYDEDGRPSYFIRQIQDIGSRKAVEHELRLAEKAALAANESKSRFLATMSHEIRTPMNGIIGMTELLTLSPLTDEQAEYVAVVADCGRSLLRVLNDILDYSKIEAGKLDLESADFHIARLIRATVASLQPQFNVKGVSLVAEPAADVPELVRGDAGRVRQILVNLLGNALKFTPGGGSVRLAVQNAGEQQGFMPVRFTVSDTGVGIAPGLRYRLFRPFSQVDESTTRKYGGTGLGLSICKQLVELMGGRIGVESAPHEGSSFWFTVPFLRGADESVTSADGESLHAERRALDGLRNEKLLLAEDNEVNTLLAVRQFKRLGFAVTAVPDGRRAVDAHAQEPFDMIFMDCHMPQMDGFEATRAIRGLTPERAASVPIVALTANALREDREYCLAAGMDAYLSKPVSLEELSAVIERWLPARARKAGVETPSATAQAQPGGT